MSLARECNPTSLETRCSTLSCPFHLDRPSLICSGFLEHNTLLLRIWISSVRYPPPSLFFLYLTSNVRLLVGGPDRPPSKRMIAQARSDEEQRRRDARQQQTPSSSSAAASAAASNEGWGAWASRQLNERTEKLNLVGNSMNNLEQNSASWAEDVSKFVGKQKRGFVMGAVKSKFGF